MNDDDLNGTKFEFVIVGGGAVGCGVAFSLAQAGKSDVLVVERADALGAVTTSQGAGLAGQMRSSAERTRLAMHSVETFRHLQEHAAVKPEWHEVGSLRIALSDGAVRQFEELKAVADECGLASEMIDGEEARARWPVMDFSAVKAVLWCPSDGYMRPVSVVNSYRSECERMGVRFVTGTAVEGVMREAGRIVGVRTSRGDVTCRYLVNAAGAHAYHLARHAGLELPIVPVRHEYFVTVELPGLDPNFPCFRIPDLTLYGRVDGRGLLLGGWEPRALSVDPREIPAQGEAPAIDPDWHILEDFEEKLSVLFPGVAGSAKKRVGKGWPTFTPDGQFFIGESSRVPGLVMAGGCNAHGISGSGGIGKLLVESLLEPSPSPYVKSLSPDRFADGAWNWEEASVQARRVYETYYGIGE